MKFYERPEFKTLNAQWRAKLARSGFDDIEDDDGRIKPHNIECHPTKRVLHFDETLEFFLKLDAWLQTRPKLCLRHRRILEMYSTGQQSIVEIAIRKNVSRQLVTRVISKAKRLLLSGF